MGSSGLATIPYINSDGIAVNSGNLRVSNDVYFTKYNTSIASYLKINEFNSSINNINNTFTTLLNTMNHSFTNVDNTCSRVFANISTTNSVITTQNTLIFVFFYN